MSYQAYLDAVEAKTGKTPQQLLDEAGRRGYGPQTRAATVVDWLKEEYGVGRGHAMAFYGVLKNGPTIPREACGLFRQSSRRVAHLAARRYSGAVVVTPRPPPRNLTRIARP
jgi:Domain of unknown function (DUF4287)